MGNKMAANNQPRFSSCEAALRFYFRAQEFLAPDAKPGLLCENGSRPVCRGPNVIEDVLTLDACFRGIEEMQLWLLREMYGPGGFGMTARPAAAVSKALREKFPDHDWNPNEVVISSKDALAKFEEHLKIERLL